MELILMEIIKLHPHMQDLIGLNLHDPMFLAVVSQTTQERITSTYDTSYGEYGVVWTKENEEIEGRIERLSTLSMSTPIVNGEYHYIRLSRHNILDLKKIVESLFVYKETSDVKDLYDPGKWMTFVVSKESTI